MAKNKWYIGGLHFACQQCGSCCCGPDEGVIWISRPEINMLAEHLGLSASELRKKYLRRIGFRFSIRENPCSKDCVFLANLNGFKGCTIYNARPMQCRNWPFWPGNLQSPDDWNTAAKKCPGINKGRFYSFDEIEKIKNQKQWWNNTNKNKKQSPSDSAGGIAAIGTAALQICAQVKQIYDWLDENIKPLNNKCDACGKCCNFDSFGHKLFVTTPELLYFSRNVKNSRKMSTQTCPYLDDGKCGARNHRFAGCRIFFCKSAGGCLTAEDKDLQNKLSEQASKKFKAICEKYDLPYRYIDLPTALSNPEMLNLIESL
ncbi:MAG: YkgJ family cysteine cluster protein [Phycisphaerae bacterium]|nr:YkgJ family cysteine cluster protein [Phycisphaerae bacterium]